MIKQYESLNWGGVRLKLLITKITIARQRVPFQNSRRNCALWQYERSSELYMDVTSIEPSKTGVDHTSKFTAIHVDINTYHICNPFSS